jgi:DNA-binding CsgD family transcriptional regulator
MPQIDPDLLAPVASRLLDRARLTPAERAEVLRIAQGFTCKDSAAAAGVSPDTIRARRKRIYRKLALEGSRDVVVALLALSLGMLARRDAAPLAPGEPLVAGAPPLPGSERNLAVSVPRADGGRLDPAHAPG